LFQKLVDFGRKHQILIVHDNPYSFILNPEPDSILTVEGAMDVALELNSLSKTYNIPGWRVGMVAGNAAYINAILQVKSNMDSGMYLGIQHGAVAAMNLGQDWFKELETTYTARRMLVWKLADTLGLTYKKNTGGMFVWAKLPVGISSTAYADWLLNEKQIFITPGIIFGDNSDNYIRFSLCLAENLIHEAIKRVSTLNKEK
jgi:LL-diaminopimelate aminotransferase